MYFARWEFRIICTLILLGVFFPGTLLQAQTTEDFTCDSLRLYDPYLYDNQIYATLENLNPQDSILTGSQVIWNAPDLLGVSDTYLRSQWLNTTEYWTGSDSSSPTDSVSEGNFVGVDLLGASALSWGAMFNDLPADISAYATIWDFAGTVLYIDHPLQGPDCAVPLELPEPPATFTVNTTADENDGTCDETHCSLREAIIAAKVVSGIVNIRLAAMSVQVPITMISM